MKIVDIFKSKKPVVSFEIFPPRPDVPLEEVFNKLEGFKALKPDYISVTYGAGGSQKGRTIEIASKLKNEYSIEALAHFTCVGHSREEIDSMLDTLKAHNIENVLALRGDPPVNQPDFDFSKNAYQYAQELVEHIGKKDSFCVGAAAYVEGHVDSVRLKDDLRHLKEKVDKGADFLVTQLFFDNRIFYDFIDKAASINIKCPVSAGVMPVFKADQIKTIAAKSGCSIPAKLVLIMDKYGSNPDDMLKAAIEYAGKQLRDLAENGADGIHLYTMNRVKSTKEILKEAGLLRLG